MPKAIVAAIATFVTIGLTLVYAAMDEQRFFIYLPYAIRGSADTPVPTSIEDRVLALETQVAQLSKLLTPTPSPVPTILEFSAVPTPSATSRYSYAITATLTKVDIYGSETLNPQVALTGTISRDGLPYKGAFAYITYARYDSDLSSIVERGIETATKGSSMDCVDCVGPFGGFNTKQFFSSMTDASGVFTATLAFAKEDLGRIVPIDLKVITGPYPYPYSPLGTKYIWLK